MFTLQPLQDLADAQLHYQVLSAPAAAEQLHRAPSAATSTCIRWHGDCRGLGDDVTEQEFLAVCASGSVRALYGYAFSPSPTISRAYERLLRQHDWHHSQLIIQAIEAAANHVMRELHASIEHLVWAASTARWQRHERQGIRWNAVVLVLGPENDPDYMKQRLPVIHNTGKLYSAASDALTENLTNAWPEWRNATG